MGQALSQIGLRRASSLRWERGFTLVEMMVTLAIIALGMSLMFGMGENLLPQTRLKASAVDVGTDITTMRSHALLTQLEVVFTYHLDEDTWSAHYPHELDEEGHVLGPGETIVMEPKPAREGMDLVSVELADGSIRSDGEVQFTISRLGRIAPHWVLFENPDLRELERMWVQVRGLTNAFEVIEDRPEERVVMTDASFR